MGSQIETPEALATIEFKNSSSKPITILFHFATGKGGYEEEERTNTPHFRLKFDGHAQSGAAVSTVTYKWVNGAGTSVVQGSGDIYQNPVNLAPGTTAEVPVLIKLPPVPGKYALTLTFDNRCVQSAAHTYNTTILTWKVNGINPVFFTQSTMTTVDQEIVR